MKGSSNRFKEKKKNKKVWLIPLVIAAVILGLIGSYWLYNNWQANKEAQKRQAQAEQLLQGYLDALTENDMTKFVTLLSEDSINDVPYNREEIRERYKTIFSGIGAANIENRENELIIDEETDQYKFTYTLAMDTSLGRLEDLKYETTFSEVDDKMFVDWDTSLIFPDMEEGDTVKLSYDEGERGSINDRNGNMLAGNGSAWEAGILPSSLGEGDARKSQLSSISENFGIEVSSIEKLLEQSWVTDESFVPIKVVDADNRPELAGVVYRQTESRMYPLGEAAAHLTGYVGEVTAEDIESNPTLQTGDTVGKAGLEAAFDERLRGIKGGQIYIETESGENKKVLVESEKKDGENIRLTIDMDLQKEMYDQLQGEPGAAVVMAPDSGELLVAASSPSYDPQLFVEGISNEQYQKYTEDEDSPFLARYAQRYAPGSTFKILTSMIGLDLGITSPDKTHRIEGLEWQPNDNSFGDHKITRVSDAVTEVNLQAAITYSDNIYFAMEALEMGEKDFVEKLSQFPFGANMNLPFSMQPAQISNDGTLNRPTLLADTAYGQGELLMSPIHQISFYSAVVNKGAMTFPQLELEGKVNQLSPVSEESAQLIKKDLVAAVKDTDGTAHAFSSLPFTVGAKTGTAEVSEDGENVTNGFVYAFDADDNDFTFMGFLEGKGSGDVVDRFLPVLSDLKVTE
ncbi:penicillin-binding transpeptidase domain-containing protein [Marinilactibacillus psychrotolerans]|uniref:Penicillin-binding transpeptidase domain-containing protein n=1 Tax=Marinilactibacillus psychrotolerans TaxID=191770 RepID=A0ABW8UIE5_9LACT|nr:penicillin-binding transpeptidase domain-containing protein [Marinilactibacillus psychrotolerans]GEQ34449.1 penicillin-binding protein 3 [Marinilactibacillus psychrotolerans]